MMMILAGMFLIPLGLLMLFSPALWYEIAESWKSNASGEPSGLYCIHTRIGGALSLVAGVGAIILQFL